MRKAFLAAWIIVSVGAMALLAASFVLTPDAAARILPPCEWQVALNRACPLCGMTRSFMHAARGELGRAMDANRAGPPLFLLLVMNEIVLGAGLAARLRGRLKSKRRRDRKRTPCRLPA